MKRNFKSEDIRFKEGLKQIQKADFKGKTKDKVVQIEVYPSKLEESQQTDDKLKRKFDSVMSRYNELYKIIGPDELSHKFILPDSLYSIATKVKYSLEKNMADNKYNSIRTNFTTIMDDFNEINKILNNYQNEFHKEQMFGQAEIEKVSLVDQQGDELL